jgi:hypothetical protein
VAKNADTLRCWYCRRPGHPREWHEDREPDGDLLAAMVDDWDPGELRCIVHRRLFLDPEADLPF